MMAPATLHSHSFSAPNKTTNQEDSLRRLRLAVYAYILLWILEGALRKWILPGLSAPLLIVRDPVLIYIYFEAFRLKVFKLNGYILFMLVLSTLSIIVSLGLFKAPPLKVIAFGIRANFLHLPFIFLIPQILTYSDVKKIGRIIVWLAPPMALLTAWQFLSPSGARINVGAGGEGKMIETAFDRIRPSGTFSFTNGLAEYTVLLAAFLFHHLLEKNVFQKLAFLLAAPALLILVVMSGSRTTFALVGLEILTVFIIWFIKPRFAKSSMKVFAIAAAVIFIIGSVGALRIGMDVIAARFSTSGGLKEGFLIRLLDEFKKPIVASANAEIGGVGIGMGTNVASSMMYNMLRFNLGESEMDRIIMEMGPYLGLPYLLWRFAVVFLIARMALVALRLHNNTLPLFLATACAYDLAMGQFGQSTVLGFAVMSAGLALASTRRREEEELIGLQESQNDLKKPFPMDPRNKSPLPSSISIPSPYAEMLRNEIEYIPPNSLPTVTNKANSRNIRKPVAVTAPKVKPKTNKVSPAQKITSNKAVAKNIKTSK